MTGYLSKLFTAKQQVTRNFNLFYRKYVQAVVLLCVERNPGPSSAESHVGSHLASTSKGKRLGVV